MATLVMGLHFGLGAQDEKEKQKNILVHYMLTHIKVSIYLHGIREEGKANVTFEEIVTFTTKLPFFSFTFFTEKIILNVRHFPFIFRKSPLF